MKSSAIEFVPDSDFSYVLLRRQARQRAKLMFYTPQQVEDENCNAPMFMCIVSQQDLRRMARASLIASGDEDLAKLVPVDRESTPTVNRTGCNSPLGCKSPYGL
jgi:hypothetical protein